MTKTLQTPPDLGQLAREPEPAPFEVRGRPGIHILISSIAGVTALAYLWRAIDGGSPILWLMVAVLVGVAVMHLLGRREAALPRLVADDHGVRVRQRSRWIGLPWDDIDRVEVAAMHGPLGATVVRLIPTDDEPVEIRCGASTRLSPDDIVMALRPLSGPRTPICRGVAPSQRSLPSDDTEESEESEESGAPGESDQTVADETGSRRAVRAQVHRPDPGVIGMIPMQPVPERSERAAQADDAKVLEPEADAAAAAEEPESDGVPEPAAATEQAPMIRAEVEASIGPLLAAARFRQRLSVDELGERTRIRPHVIEAIENDDFAPCGGDFYARGHLRSLCRVLGVESEPILEAFDRRYSHAPIGARTVFEAELATGPRPTFRSIGRPANWIALLVVAMVLAIVWAVAMFLTSDDDSGAKEQSALSNASAPPDDQRADLGGPAVNELTLRGVGESTRVTVKDADSERVWRGRLRAGESQDVSVAGPVTVIADDGGAVRLRLNGDGKGRLGDAGEPARLTVGHR
jgi:cytoskeleton protein RodZ